MSKIRIVEDDSKGLDTTAALRIFDRYFTVENGKCNTGLVHQLPNN